MEGIQRIGPGIGSALGGVAGTGRDGDSFASALRQAVERVSRLEMESAAEIQRFLTGETEDPHETLLAVQKTELAFEMLLQVRNKVV